jgi:rod shape-determining protein MreC
MSAYGRTDRGRSVQGRMRAGVLAVAVGLALLGVSALDQTLLAPTRNAIVAWSEPIVSWGARNTEPVRSVLAHVVAPFSGADEIERLRAENVQLKAAAIRVEEVERDNRDLTRLLRLSPGPAVESVAARVMSVSPDLVSSAIMIGAGLDQLVGVGDPVVANDVLFGRVVRAGAITATVVRLVDVRSRVPVVVGPHQARAVLTGDGSGAPRLEFISPEGVVREGDGVMTSGVGGVIARGLVVGRVIREPSGWRVQLPGGSDVPRVVAVLRRLQSGDEPGVRVDVGQGFGPGLTILERRRVANRVRAGGSP